MGRLAGSCFPFDSLLVRKLIWKSLITETQFESGRRIPLYPSASNHSLSDLRSDLLLAQTTKIVSGVIPSAFSCLAIWWTLAALVVLDDCPMILFDNANR